MLSGPSIGAWCTWALFGAFSALETMLLPSSAATWSSQLIVDAFPSGKAAESLRGGSFLKESLPVITLGAVGVLGSEPTLSSSLSPEEDENKASGEGFLEAEEAETLLEEPMSLEPSPGVNLLSSSRTGSREEIK